MRKKPLRANEEFVMNALTHSLGGQWTAGEDPPDAYLDLEGRKIAIEISTLAQLVAADNGHLEARMGQDAAAIRLAGTLKRELSSFVAQNRILCVVLRAPIIRVRKTEQSLVMHLKEKLGSAHGRKLHFRLKVNGNDFDIDLEDSHGERQSRVSCIIMNSRSSADIAANARIALESRIAAKALRYELSGVRETLWLALFNDYWLADAETYRREISDIAIHHNFNRILMVSGSGEVECLLQRGS